ncbi:hypothetical protein HG531_002531 [Fusarium graminearum]|nr:hypothetical protein HG531_002531 [Fusarium graminearum]
MSFECLNLLHILQVVKRRKVANLYPLRPHKDTVLEFRRLSPVPRASDTAVVLANGLVQLDSNPAPEAAGNLLDLTDVLDDAASSILTANATPAAYSDAPRGDLSVEGAELGLLVARGVGIETAQLLSLLPGQHRV